MRSRQVICDSFAVLLSYPDGRYKQALLECRNALHSLPASQRIVAMQSGTPNELAGDALDELLAFQTLVESQSTVELEELYTRTFDISPSCCLEIGWHLFGESYDRGAFLVRMRDVLRRLEIRESSELPDHLSHALLALGRMPDEEAREFGSAFIDRALGKMLEGFHDLSNPYHHLIKAIALFVRAYHCHPAGVEL